MACASSFRSGSSSLRLRGRALVYIAAALALAFVGSAALARQTPQNPPQTYPILDPDASYKYAIKGLGIDPGAVFQTAHAARINDDPRADVVVMRGTSPVVFVNPATWDAALRVPLEGSSAAILPGTAEGQDEIVVTTAAGLRGAWRDSSASFATRTIGADGLWAGAEWIATAQLDGAAGADLYGVRNDVGFAGVLLSDGSSAGDGFHDEVIIPLQAYPVRHGTAADLDGNGLRSLAFTSGAGLHVYHENGVFDAFSGGSLGRAVTIDSETPGKECIVWIAQVTGLGDVLYIIDDTGISDPVELGGAGLIGLRAVDLDHDGDDDLVGSVTRSHDLVVYWNVDGTFASDALSVLAVGETGPAADNRATPAAADFDGDGDVDLFHPIQSAEDAFVWNNTHLPSSQTTPQLGAPTLFNFVARDPDDDHTLWDGYLQLELHDAPTVPFGATHLELFIWRKDMLVSPTKAAPETGHAFRFPVGAAYDPGVIVLEEPEPSLFFFQFQYVTLDANDERTAMFPPATFALTPGTPEGLENLDWLLAVSTSQIHATTVPDPIYEQSGGVIIESETVSTIVTVDPIIEYDDDDEPEDDLSF